MCALYIISEICLFFKHLPLLASGIKNCKILGLKSVWRHFSNVKLSWDVQVISLAFVQETSIGQPKLAWKSGRHGFCHKMLYVHAQLLAMQWGHPRQENSSVYLSWRMVRKMSLVHIMTETDGCTMKTLTS